MLEDVLSQRKHMILDRWLTAVLETYPPDTVRHLREGRDRFANPVGRTIAESLEALLGELLGGAPVEVSPALEAIVRIRAVQDFAPSRALEFVPALKRAVREALGPGRDDARAQLDALDARIDALTLRAFDAFVACREKVFEIKANEVRARTAKLLERAERMYGRPEAD